MHFSMLSVLVATFAAFIFGALWYSPLLFIKPWGAAAGVDLGKGVDNPAKVYGLTFVQTLLAALAMAVVLGAGAGLTNGLLMGGLIGACVVSTSLGINYLFAEQKFNHWLIDAGFHIGRFVLIGGILGGWPG